jgi:hypothetical protein
VPAGTEVTVHAGSQVASVRIAEPRQRGREVVVVVKPDGTLLVAPLSSGMGQTGD